MKQLFNYETVNILMCDQTAIFSDNEKIVKIEYTTRYDFLGPLMVMLGFPDLQLIKCEMRKLPDRKFKTFVLPLEDYEKILYILHDKILGSE